MSSPLKFLDLFAGAGGLSEGFIRAGFKPIAHVEADASACYTLKTRQAFHWLKKNNALDIYSKYLRNEITRQELYDAVPSNEIDSVINEFIGPDTLKTIFQKVDSQLNNSKLDLIIGGPPCQAYSLIGRARGNMDDDPRNHLYKYYAEFLKKYKPKYFVFENVLGLLTAKDPNNELYFDKMKNLFIEIGYSIEYKVLSANEYGVLQNRKRIILVGKRGHRGKKSFYPEIAKWVPEATVWDLLNDLPKISAGGGKSSPSEPISKPSQWLKDAYISTNLPLTWHEARPHSEQDLEIYKHAVKLWNTEKRRLHYDDLPEHLKSHKGRNSFVDRFKVVAGDLTACHTVVAHISKDGHHYIHPDIVQNRSLTPREAARIQSFPDDYYFENVSGKPARTIAFKQIGNAVPVLLAQKIAEKILEGW
ncbi:MULTISPECIES: DNA cytosine methyltransferase [Acinetobacter]|uniref:DNA cytosine methyltransferase n=1 Tax=Acinetobacter TaxID=469 RepID=UPI0013732495|nr:MULTISPECIES: DNA cytosine methyltransferase [Acinetobacter]NAR59651.1 DNA (cytosine-5-)-methyltransferase [Acinetobacter haemolyticus]NAR92166.1 DNA (cytosine-5-)-methyltransferase [Acinetobacter haemolyticus]VTX67539.1 Modification methylase HaeIII [Acinetobacter junii]